MKYILVVFIGLLFGGCFIIQPPITEYMIDVKLPQQSVENSSKKSVKVSKSFINTKLQTLNMNYAQGDKKVYIYSKSMWAELPSEMVTAKIVKLLQDKKIFKVVQTSKSRSKTDIILETNIEDFMQYFDDELKTSYVNVSITFTLIDTKTNKVIASKNFESRVVSSSLDALGGVEALSKALSEVLQKSSIWLSKIEK
jgi:cholesterol transport system auxiliary component